MTSLSDADQADIIYTWKNVREHLLCFEGKFCTIFSTISICINKIVKLI